MNYDHIVIIVYIIGIFCLAYHSSKSVASTNEVEEKYLAGKSLTFRESMASIIATEVSALTFLGIPSFAFGSNFSFVQIYFGAAVGRLAIAYIILPRVYDKGLTIYSVMAQDNQSSNGQKAVASFYVLNKILAVGVRLFSGSILVAEFFSISIYSAVALISLLTFAYTLIGGLKAVVRTDMIQMCLFIVGGLVAHYLIPHTADSTWSELMSIAHTAGKTQFFSLDNPSSFIIGFMGGILFDMSTHGVDQDYVQRLTANKSLKGAQKAIILSSVFSILIGFLFLSIGALLWSYYQTAPQPDLANDKIFAHFITTYFPEGLKGLMVAGVLAATMSTLDSTINALSACFYNDIFQIKKDNPKSISYFYRRDTLIITLLLAIVASIAAQSSGILIVGLKVTSWTAGSLLSLFFLTVVFKNVKLSAPVVIVSYLSGALGVYLNTFHFHWNWNFNIYLGFIFSSIVTLILAKKILRD